MGLLYTDLVILQFLNLLILVAFFLVDTDMVRPLTKLQSGYSRPLGFDLAPVLVNPAAPNSSK